MKLLSVLLACLLDLLLGDPAWMPHPVVLMGRVITWAEPRLRKVFPPTERGERRAGKVLALGLPLAVLVLSLAVLWLLWNLYAPAALFLQVLWGWQCLALRDLMKESRAVLSRLSTGTLEDARHQVARIVGRDTDRLSEAGVIRATVETVAENFSDGVIAPLLCLFLGGAPLALCYKAVNTLDSMIGYRNAQYLNFGRCAARLDDAANFLPARLSALLLIVASAICGLDAGNAWRIWRRDRRQHLSPNAGQTEAVMAGALHVALGGPSSYFGAVVQKPVLGDDDRAAHREDIRRANRLVICGSVLGLILFSAFSLLAYFICWR